MSLSEAFRAVCTEAEPADPHYVSLYVENRCYGGPEDGGWYYDRCTLESSQWYPTRELAEAAMAEIEKKAKELTRDASIQYGRAMQEQVDWCEARGLDADYLTENDGADEYVVRIEKTKGEWIKTEVPHYE